MQAHLACVTWRLQLSLFCDLLSLEVYRKAALSTSSSCLSGLHVQVTVASLEASMQTGTLSAHVSAESEHSQIGQGLVAAIEVVERHISPERSRVAWSDDVLTTACEPCMSRQSCMAPSTCLSSPQRDAPRALWLP